MSGSSTPTPEGAATRMTDEHDTITTIIADWLNSFDGYDPRPGCSDADHAGEIVAALSAAGFKIVRSLSAVRAPADEGKRGDVMSDKTADEVVEVVSKWSAYNGKCLREYIDALRAPANEAEIAEAISSLTSHARVNRIQGYEVTAKWCEGLIVTIRRLTASLSSVGRERDEARADREETQEYWMRQVGEERDIRSVLSGDLNDTHLKLKAAESALAVALVERDRAREAALEEAAKVALERAEHWRREAAALPQIQPPHFSVLDMALLSVRDMALQKMLVASTIEGGIRALSPAPNATEAE